MLILALDLGKFKTMCCFFDTKTRKAEFQVAATERDYLSKVLVVSTPDPAIELQTVSPCSPADGELDKQRYPIVGSIGDYALSETRRTNG